MNLKSIATPNAKVDNSHTLAILVGWGVLLIASWFLFKPAILPGPWKIVTAWPELMANDGLGQAVMSSLTTNLIALTLSSLIALPTAYLSRVPVFAPVSSILSQLRFLSPSIFFIVLLFAVGTPSAVKVWMLTLGITFFLTTTMVTVVDSIPNSQYDDAKLLRMSDWEATWYVTVRGTLPQAFDALRDNAAMGWSMLMMVEGFVRSEGGVGVLLLNQEKYFNFAALYAIAATILVVGLVQDWMIKSLKEVACPWITK